jgi:catechol 2,3-dioxygenase-like lactoylglutathione lyase family enzyme
MNGAVKIDRIDHIVLTVHDLERTIAFYSRVLGMEPVTFAGGRRGLAFGRQKLNLHQAGREFEPKALAPAPGAIDICFISETPLADVIAKLEAEGVVIIEGPVDKTGALGPMKSVYFRDPDGNLIEVSNYPA